MSQQGLQSGFFYLFGMKMQTSGIIRQIDAVLIGESFMRRQDIAGAVSSMRGL